MIKDRVVSTIIIVLFLLHPNITLSTFMAFSCTSIDGTNRVFDDLEILCDEDAHKILSNIIALPAFLIWGVGIPSFVLFILIRNRNELTDQNFKQRFGFVYSGYKTYYWEPVIMFRKIFIIFIQVFLL
jgi:hypothetical protein